VLYWIGDFNCHQKEERSIILNDNQMPYCARDVGMFLGMTAGALLMVWSRPRFSIWETSVSMLPESALKKVKGVMPIFFFAVMFWGAFLVPMMLDGGYQLLTDYESTNPVRIVTGFFGGMALGVMLLAPILSALAPWEEETK
jgi:uncharacterized membrane protein